MRLLAEWFPEFAEKFDEIDEIYREMRSIDEKTSVHLPSTFDQESLQGSSSSDISSGDTKRIPPHKDAILGGLARTRDSMVCSSSVRK